MKTAFGEDLKGDAILFAFRLKGGIEVSQGFFV